MNWFIHTSNERRGIIILLVILVIAIILPSLLPEPQYKPADIDRFRNEIDAFYQQLEQQAHEQQLAKDLTLANKWNHDKRDREKKLPQAFHFDPNTADSIIFCKLGFSPKQARSIVNYRSKGKKFKVKEDFKDVFVVSDEMYLHLRDYIQINSIEPAQTNQSVEKQTLKPVFDHSISVNINTADTSEIKKLKAIGSYFARRIVDYRDQLGGYYSANQLLEIKGLDQKRLAQFENQLRVDTFYIRKLAINKLTDKELKKHPYIDAYTAKGIVTYRNFTGRIQSIQLLVKERILKQEQADRLAPYLSY